LRIFRICGQKKIKKFTESRDLALSKTLAERKGLIDGCEMVEESALWED